ncbi:hypothetical protein NSA50_02095 [Clostridium sp. DSM 100503]|uniref:hypothetical protein n=1 Tax=Clostridium sp. DSM 100503 TaxID=2963282 RepID=UPI00214A268E|nr:hypothetical protein [Clostridium sp. DSM 100503]MCR1949849.1 hypothetical protein [Clostridium sp. DSM 100503]
MSLKIRRFDNNDSDIVSKIICRNFLEVNIKDYPKEEMESLVKLYNSEKILNIASYTHMYVACIDDNVVGCGAISSFWGSKDESILLAILLYLNYRGKA